MSGKPDFILHTFLAACDSLQNCVDADPHRFVYFARADGEVLGQLPLDIQQALAGQPKKNTRKNPSELLRQQWSRRYQLQARIEAVVPGGRLELALPPDATDKDLEDCYEAARNRCYRIWGIEFVGRGEVDGHRITIERRVTAKRLNGRSVRARQEA